jgi:DNA-binding transcriptional regulator LsrR (DeoR family)
VGQLAALVGQHPRHAIVEHGRAQRDVFEEGLSQREIASRTGYSVSMISRMLLEARREGLVEIRIHRQLKRNIELETQLQDLLGLKIVRVLSHEQHDYDQMMHQLGRLAARLVEELLHDNINIGVSVGTGVFETVQAIRQGSCFGAHVIQLAGTFRSPHFEGDGQALTQHLARSLIGYYTPLPAPLYVAGEDTLNALITDPQIQRTFSQYERIELALVGIGTLDPEISELCQAGYFKSDDLLLLEQLGAVGDVCGHFVDLYGNIVDNPLPICRVGISSEVLGGIPLIIGIAGGLFKVLPTIGAARANQINVLVTDEVAAQKIVAFFKRLEEGYEDSERLVPLG